MIAVLSPFCQKKPPKNCRNLMDHHSSYYSFDTYVPYTARLCTFPFYFSTPVLQISLIFYKGHGSYRQGHHDYHAVYWPTQWPKLCYLLWPTSKKNQHVSFTTQFMSASVKFISARFTVLEINPLCIKFKLQSDVVICHRLRMWSANYTQFVVRKVVQGIIYEPYFRIPN